ncbi:MAG: glycosyltransferase [Sphingomonas taxi]
MTGRIGYFVHHQGRGHAERAAAIVHALAPGTSVTLFCARPDILPPLPASAEVIAIPSLFEAPEDAPAELAQARTPAVLHCAPLGWRTITDAVATIAGWFRDARPALFITDVSAELALLARIASVPCVTVLQHGDRADPGHIAAYESAVGILAPYHVDLEQPERPAWMRDRIAHFGGLGVKAGAIDRAAARRRLGLAPDAEIVTVVAGGGGDGTPLAPLTLGARAEPDSLWLTIGAVAKDWHATVPGNLRQIGWVDDPADWIAAADRVVSSTGNTTVHMVAAAGRPWIVVPEWRYFDEQLAKARALAAAGAAVALDHWPGHVDGWREAWIAAADLDPATQRRLVDGDAPRQAADWLRGLAALSDDAPVDTRIIAEIIA